MNLPRWRRLIAVLGTILLIAGCAKSVQVPRDDWGAITRDATVRITRTDGQQMELSEVTVFEEALEGLLLATGSPTRIPLSEIDFVETRTGINTLAVLTAIAAAVTTIAIVQATGEDDTRPPSTPANSCPFIYSFDGEDFRLDSETFAGAVSKGMQRTDLDNLEHLRAVDGEFRLHLVNERSETQYTDLVNLLVVDHAEGSLAYPDVTGEPRIFLGGSGPRSARGLLGGDASQQLAEVDDHVWVGAPVATADLDDPASLRDGVELSFARPSSDEALLAVRARNTELAPYALQTFLELQGDDLVHWYREVDRDEGLQSRLRNWVLREGTLQVSVWTGQVWQLQDVLLDVGPHLAKTQVARLDLSSIPGDDVRVRLETARGRWTLDWVELGSAGPEEPVVHLLTPTVARGPGGADMREALSGDDDAYLTALPNDRVELAYDAPDPPAPGWTRTIMARTSGYYHIYVDQSGDPQPDLVERILDEPLFGNRYMLGRLRAEAETEAAGIGR